MITGQELYNTLVSKDSDQLNSFTLDSDTSESDVVGWLESKNTSKLKQTAIESIDRQIIEDFNKELEISGQKLSINEIIKSHNDKPKNFEVAYILNSGRTIVQYKKRGVSGNQPLSLSNAEQAMQDHANEMAERLALAELLKRAKTEF